MKAYVPLFVVTAFGAGFGAFTILIVYRQPIPDAIGAILGAVGTVLALRGVEYYKEIIQRETDRQSALRCLTAFKRALGDHLSQTDSLTAEGVLASWRSVQVAFLLIPRDHIDAIIEIHRLGVLMDRLIEEIEPIWLGTVEASARRIHIRNVQVATDKAAIYTKRVIRMLDAQHAITS